LPYFLGVGDSSTCFCCLGEDCSLLGLGDCERELVVATAAIKIIYKLYKKACQLKTTGLQEICIISSSK